jgi:hypothetical protein
MRFLGRILALAAAVVVLASAAPAQETTATLTGTVTDATGGVLPGVTVNVKNVGTGFTKDVVTDAEGRYTAPLLPVGRYEAAFAMDGFQTSVARDLELHVNDRIQLDMTLSPGGLTETVEVAAPAPMIQHTPAVQALMGPTEVQELPLNNRNFVQLATLVPGVSSALPDEVGIGLTNVVSLSMNGARRNAVNWLVDGASNVDVGSNITLLSTPTLESIEEFKIITSSYAAEWPRSGGGIVNVVTKSGTNQFRASAYEFFRSDALNANSFFRQQQGCRPDGTCSGAASDVAIRENPPKLDYHNFGFTVGGPIRRDKLFFFFSQEWRRIERAPTDRSAAVPPAAWLEDPANPNYVAPADRDPNAVRLLSLYPAANLGADRFLDSQPNEQDTRQSVLRLDWLISPTWRLMTRYTHDLSETTEAGGLFFNTAIPDVATTLTDAPGKVFVGQVTTTLGSNTVNELSVQYTGNAIRSAYGENVRNTRSALSLAVPEIFPENRNQLIPSVAISGLATIGANQLFDNRYENWTVAENLTHQRGAHQFKGGFLVAFEAKDEISGSATQGSFNFAAGGGRTAFQNFLLGNRDGSCGAACTYTEPEFEISSQFRWRRYEFYVQDTWRVSDRLRLDLGMRYSVQPGFRDANDVLTNFVPARYDRSRAPSFANPTGTALVVGTGDPLNGIVVAGRNSPYGRAVNGTAKNDVMPRAGFSWDATDDGRTVVRGGYGLYYDQPLMGIFLQNAFVNPPFTANPQVLNPALSNPGAGTSATTRAPGNLIAISDPFDMPRTQQWNVGVQRELYRRGVIDVSYAGSKGDHLIQPVDINQPQPPDVVATGALNLARPYPGYGTINVRQTTAHSLYHGLLVSFRHDGGRAGLFNVSYTLSRAKTSATNDRDAVDFPQNPLDLEAEYALARTDRTHVFTASYVYELPFFRDSGGLARALLGGWQVSGITQFWSGPPISRVVNGTTNGSRRGVRVNQVGDPLADLPADAPGGVYWFDPAAFAPPADGTYGNTGRAIFRLPGVNQWDITLSKNWYPTKATRLQFRADFINAFNHTQLDPTAIQNVCTVAVTDATCAGSSGNFGRITGTRAPREIQLGLRLSWN